MKIGISLLIIALTGVTVLAQNPPTLRIVTETPGLPSDLYYRHHQGEALTVSPGTNQVITINDIDFLYSSNISIFLACFPDATGFANWNATLNACPNGGYGENANPNATEFMCPQASISLMSFKAADSGFIVSTTLRWDAELTTRSSSRIWPGWRLADARSRGPKQDRLYERFRSEAGVQSHIRRISDSTGLCRQVGTNSRRDIDQQPQLVAALVAGTMTRARY